MVKDVLQWISRMRPCFFGMDWNLQVCSMTNLVFVMQVIKNNACLYGCLAAALHFGNKNRLVEKKAAVAAGVHEHY